MKKFKQYRSKDRSEFRPYIVGEELPKCVEIIPEDKKAGHPKQGDMIARNPKYPKEQWLIPKKIFEHNFEEV